jgi:hypothetical protein
MACAGRIAKLRIITLDYGLEKLRQQCLWQLIERVGPRPIAPDKAADLPGKHCREARKKQRAREFARSDGTNEKS